MPLSQLDSTPALIVIDLQKGILGRQLAHPSSEVLARSAQLARAFRERNLPVVLVHVEAAPPGRTDSPRMDTSAFPPDWTNLAPELEQQPTDILITKRSWDAFVQTSLDGLLRKLGVTQIVLAGIATSIGVESTARSAHAYGYNVVLATDAMTDLSLDNHNHSIEKVFPRLGESEVTEKILKRLAC